jgi:thioredoxin-related protein
MKNILFTVITVFLFISVQAQSPSPLPADNILKEALQQAKTEKKNVFVIFHASWCTWCHRMDASMNDESCKKYFDENYVIRHLVVDESKEKKHLENPGAREMLEEYKGRGLGIPYWLVFDSGGKLLSDSRMKDEKKAGGQNVGCPASEEEVSHFIGVLKNSSSLNEEQLEIIRKRFRKNDQ